MAIRKGKLHRPCERCDEYFKPITKFQRICAKCLILSIEQRRINSMKTISLNKVMNNIKR